MFKKFSAEESISGHSQVKSSVHRNIKKAISQQYPALGDQLELMMPKKVPMFELKWSEARVTFVVCGGEAWFFRVHNGPYLPMLRTLHKYPDLLPRVRVDRGAIKFVMKGADIMCPGLTSKGGNLDTPVDANKPVAIYAEGKTHAVAVGITKMSTADIRSINKGTGIENVHFLGDGLFLTKFNTE